MIAQRADRVAALLFLFLGTAVTISAGGMGIGTLRTAGPGMFPLAIGVVMCVLSAGVLVGTFRNESTERIERIRLRELSTALGAVVLFAALVETAGLAVAMLVSVFCASFSIRGVALRERLLMSVVLSVVCWVIFILFLKLPIPVWGPR